ncbi:MAG: hypothetical protein M1817_000205 [Caeruleum heppii]|nr:MAG: hypothetical protein M1817_000205 [Caeruleum heppii]
MPSRSGQSSTAGGNQGPKASSGQTKDDPAFLGLGAWAEPELAKYEIRQDFPAYDPMVRWRAEGPDTAPWSPFGKAK